MCCQPSRGFLYEALTVCSTWLLWSSQTTAVLRPTTINKDVFPEITLHLWGHFKPNNCPQFCFPNYDYSMITLQSSHVVFDATWSPGCWRRDVTVSWKAIKKPSDRAAKKTFPIWFAKLTSGLSRALGCYCSLQAPCCYSSVVSDAKVGSVMTTKSTLLCYFQRRAHQEPATPLVIVRTDSPGDLVNFKFSSPVMWGRRGRVGMGGLGSSRPGTSYPSITATQNNRCCSYHNNILRWSFSWSLR